LCGDPSAGGETRARRGASSGGARRRPGEMRAGARRTKPRDWGAACGRRRLVSLSVWSGVGALDPGVV